MSSLALQYVDPTNKQTQDDLDSVIGSAEHEARDGVAGVLTLHSECFSLF